MLRLRGRSTPQQCRRHHHVLFTANLRLQTPTRRDNTIMRATGSDPEAQRWLGWSDNLLIPEPERGRLLAMEPGQGLGAGGYLDPYLLVVDQASGRAAGGAAVHTHSLEAGGWLAPAFRGRGLGRELFAAAAQFGHDHLGLATVRAGTEPANVACMTALRAAGFEPTQGPQVHHLPDGRTVPACWFRHDTAQPSRCRGA